MISNCVNFVHQVAPAGASLWLSDTPTGALSDVALQDHADIIYSAYLLGQTEKLNKQTAQAYQSMLAGARLYGRPDGEAIAEKGPNAHLTAYLLGAARLLDHIGKALMLPALFQGWKLDQLIDSHEVPLWPRAWTHHIWRVSHWIGGGPSILLQVARSGSNDTIDEALVRRVLAASGERIIDARTGLLRPFKSALLQKAFKAAYRLRHDPEIGELGGVVHILWVYHAAGVPYVGCDALFDNAWKHLQSEPFMEKVPYCLDFDIVQLARTANRPGRNDAIPLAERARRYSDDIVTFLEGDIPEGYTLHKLPGALATIHECALIREEAIVPGIGTAPIDIIKDAYWI